MTIFALVHGAWHGPWCWERVTGPLREHGHEVVVPDLPSEDTEMGLDDYADVIERELGDAQDVVLVPHSLGGLVGPVVARRRPLAALVYLNALVPEAGVSFGAQLGAAVDSNQRTAVDGVARPDAAHSHAGIDEVLTHQRREEAQKEADGRSQVRLGVEEETIRGALQEDAERACVGGAARRGLTRAHHGEHEHEKRDRAPQRRARRRSRRTRPRGSS